jgi:DNA-binding Xre family transcriptional regulator
MPHSGCDGWHARPLASRVGSYRKARAIRFTTLAALYAELRCQPGELLSFEP